MFEIIKAGMFSEISAQKYGKQDQAVSPGGPQDRFSFETGRILLSGGRIKTLEIVQAPVLEVTQSVFLTVTGAPAPCFINGIKLAHAVVYRAEEGDEISFDRPLFGFRTYLSVKKAGKKDISGQKRGPFNQAASWPHYAGKIRVVRGPEYGWLKNPVDFLGSSWRVTPEMDQMGMRIQRPGVDLVLKNNKSMVSEAVADGTVQLTPSGPIILMRHRQTTGGYPRIFNVISADIDMLAQHPPNTLIRFIPVTLAEAVKVLQKQMNDLEEIKRQLSKKNKTRKTGP